LKFLFVHQNFPGQYLHIVRDLLADNQLRDGTHEIVFMTEPNQNSLPGVRKVTYSKPPVVAQNLHPDARDFDAAMRRAEAAAKGANQIKGLGFVPDVIIGHHGWGELLNLVDVFPGVPILGYFEFFYRVDNSDVNFDPEFPMPVERNSNVRAKNCVNLAALALEQHGQVPTISQMSTYPDWARPALTLIQEGVDLEVCKPDPAARRKNLTVGTLKVTPKQKLVTYVARNLEPYRGFHTFMRALPKILDSRPDVVISMLGGDETSYGASHPAGPWREVMLKELEGKIDLTRVHFLGKIPYEQHLSLLKRSDAHVYLSYPFVASWSLRESLACGCAVIGADTDTVVEFVKHRENGMVVPTLDHNAIAETVLNVLGDAELTATLRANARKFAEQHLDMKDYLAHYRRVIERITGKTLERPAPVTAPKPPALGTAPKPPAPVTAPKPPAPVTAPKHKPGPAKAKSTAKPKPMVKATKNPRRGA
jgi:glycosyltransferase involved in cell wall biosynthesis